MTWFIKVPLVALVLGMACQNNTIELETDPGEVSVFPDSTGGTVESSTMLLLAINTIWSDSAFIQALVTSTPEGSTTDLTMQFLSLDQGSSTSPRNPVGPEYSFSGVPLDSDGSFMLDAGQITIVAEANPINGLEIITTLGLVARADGSILCGEVTGDVTAPVIAQFDGSTHAMTEISGPDAADLPTDVVAACP